MQDPADLAHPFGWDEISWFAHRTVGEQAKWLQYATRWLWSHDPAGHFEMPAQRALCDSHFAHRPDIQYFSASGTIGQGGFAQEQTIRSIWNSPPLDVDLLVDLEVWYR